MKNRPIASKSKKFVIDKLMHQVKKLRQKKAKSDEQKKLFERKADRLVEEAIILKVMANLFTVISACCILYI